MAVTTQRWEEPFPSMVANTEVRSLPTTCSSSVSFFFFSFLRANQAQLWFPPEVYSNLRYAVTLGMDFSQPGEIFYKQKIRQVTSTRSPFPSQILRRYFLAEYEPNKPSSSGSLNGREEGLIPPGSMYELLISF